VRTRTAAIGSAAFFLAAPTVVAGVVPWWITRWQTGDPPPGPVSRGAGLVLIAGGTAVLIDAFRRFVVEGHGTPAPAAPPNTLVVRGPNRWVRNPMYVALVIVITGQALWLGRPVLLVDAAATWAVTAAFVRGYEEPHLRRRFGEAYERYRAEVPPWIPRLPRRRIAKG
jgi:protein-S-isoprenylcysteine O-methyltransferase Ste14